MKRVSGRRRFVADAIIAFRLLNEARHRLIGAVFGVQRDWRTNLVTVIAIASAVDAIQRAVAAPGAQVRKVRSSPTLVGDSLIAAGVLHEAINRVTTRRAKATASAAALIVFAVVANSIRPTIGKSLHAIRAATRGVITEVRKIRDAVRRYGAEIVGATTDDDLPRVDASAERHAVDPT